MDKRVLREFGGPKHDYKKIAILVVLLLIMCFVVFNLDLSKFKEKEERKYVMKLSFKVKGIGNSTAIEYTYDAGECLLYYIRYEFNSSEEAGAEINNKELYGAGFLESRKYNVLPWANYSRLDTYYKTYSDYVNKTNLWTRLVYWKDNRIYNVETNCKEDLTKVAYELTQD